MKILTLIGLSMLPSIHSGDQVLVDKAAAFELLRVGDVITYTDPHSVAETGTTTHRVFYVHPSGKWLWTKGDGNGRADPIRVTRKNYFGRVLAVIKGGEAKPVPGPPSPAPPNEPPTASNITPNP